MAVKELMDKLRPIKRLLLFIDGMFSQNALKNLTDSFTVFATKMMIITTSIFIGLWKWQTSYAYSTVNCVEQTESLQNDMSINCHNGGSDPATCFCNIDVWPDAQCISTADVPYSLAFMPSYFSVVDEISPMSDEQMNNSYSKCESPPALKRLSHAELTVNVRQWNGRTSNSILRSLSEYNVTKLIITVTNTTYTVDEILNLGLFFPNLRDLSITGRRTNKLSLATAERRAAVLSIKFMRDLQQLDKFEFHDIDFEFDDNEVPSWITHIRQINVKSSSISLLPWWFSRAAKLERLSIRETKLTSALSASQIVTLSHLNLADNRIGDIDRMSFAAPHLQDINLSGNLINKFAFHTFAQCSQIRRLDLRRNLIKAMPDRPFLANSRLKTLLLSDNEITELNSAHFVGLARLSTLDLSGNPLTRIHPFSLISLYNVRNIAMNRCNLTSIPLAVTQCCHLESLSLADNHFQTADALPVDVLAHLTRLRHFDIARNPLMEMPPGLFLFGGVDRAGSDNKLEINLVGELISNLIEMPVWLIDSCAPSLWHLHLRNSTSYALKLRLSSWNKERIHQDSSDHCENIYKTVIANITLYRDLALKSGCESTRKFRSTTTEVTSPRNCWANTSLADLDTICEKHRRQRQREDANRVVVTPLRSLSDTTGNVSSSKASQKTYREFWDQNLSKLTNWTKNETEFNSKPLLFCVNSTMSNLNPLGDDNGFLLFISVAFNMVFITLTLLLFVYNGHKRTNSLRQNGDVNALIPLNQSAAMQISYHT